MFTKLIEKKQAKIAELKKRGLEADSADEVRSIQAQIEELNDEIAEMRTAQTDAVDTPVPANATLVNGQLRGSFPAAEKKSENPIATVEYRTAFMKFVQSGTAIPAELRAANTTNETGAAIPFTVMNEVINTVRKRYGNLYNKVRKTSVQGGVEYPVGALSATFKWINESAVSPNQKTDKLGKVIFNFHTAEIRIAQSFLSSIVTLEAFEARIAEVIAIAYLQAMDEGIVNGSGDGQMLGILNDARIPAANVIEMTAEEFSDWTAWRKKFFAKLPLGYRSGEFIFPVSTVDSYLETIADSNNNPIFNQATGLVVNDGDVANPNGRFFGRDISLVEPDVIPDFDSAEAGDIVGIFWQPQEYAINENFGFTMRRYFDEITNEWIDKALVVVDGKIINPMGFYLIKKKAS